MSQEKSTERSKRIVSLEKNAALDVIFKDSRPSRNNHSKSENGLGRDFECVKRSTTNDATPFSSLIAQDDKLSFSAVKRKS